MQTQDDTPPPKNPQLVENEPYLGPAWAVAMLILYLLKEAFPAEEYSLLWWFQMYIVGLVVMITIFALVKRHQFYKADAKREEEALAEKQSLNDQLKRSSEELD